MCATKNLRRAVISANAVLRCKQRHSLILEAASTVYDKCIDAGLCVSSNS